MNERMKGKERMKMRNKEIKKKKKLLHGKRCSISSLVCVLLYVGVRVLFRHPRRALTDSCATRG